MRLSFAILTALCVFGCSQVAPSVNSAGIVDRTPLFERVQEDMAAILSGMEQARRSERAGL